MQGRNEEIMSLCEG